MRERLKRTLAQLMVRSRRRHAESATSLEQLHLAPDTPHFNDSVYLYGRDHDGIAVATRLSVRTDAPCEVWMSVRLPGQAILEVPDVHHAKDESWAAGGARWQVLEPGRRLRVRYTGPLVQNGQRHSAALNLEFDGTSDLIDFSDGVTPSVTAAALAKEPWTRSFFEQLGEIRTVHYEQVGRLTGTIRIDDDERQVDLRSVRDHSFGRRRWTSWRRHIWFSGVRDDGVAFTLAQIRYDFVGPLTAGFWIDGTPAKIVDGSPMDTIAPPHVIPDEFTLFLIDDNGRRHHLTVSVDDVFRFELDHGDYTIHEAIARFDVDGVPAVGICEFGWSPVG